MISENQLLCKIISPNYECKFYVFQGKMVLGRRLDTESYNLYIVLFDLQERYIILEKPNASDS